MAPLYFGIYLYSKKIPPTPPGCAKSSSLGGCFGKNFNKDFKVYGKLPSCLRINNHLCQGARIEVENLCSQETNIEINGKKITDKYTYLLFKKDANGLISEDTFGSYPEKEQNISLDGIVDGQKFTISYIRTPALCR